MAVQTYSPDLSSVTGPRDKSPFVDTIKPLSAFAQEISHTGLQSALHLMLGKVLPTSM